DDGITSFDDLPDPEPIPESLMSYDSDDDDDEDEDEDEDDEGGGLPIALIVGVAFLVLIIGSLAGGFFARDMIQEMVPQTKPLYEMIGLGEPLGTGLDIQDVRSQRGTEGEIDVLIITGSIANITDVPRDVPLIRVSLFNSDGEEVQFLNLTPDPAHIPAGEKIDFKGTIMDPAATARRMEVTFTEPEHAPEGEPEPAPEDKPADE
ncbi:MAG: DUF3426 domain-containing protein, partial [Rhodospirillales bacterium]|nr:DUF3426 domain-containing protein [Rhodospirillales bacterium]